MTDEDRPGPGEDSAPETELDPGREAEVRRLLADARETGPPPPDVVARLDETLASLQREERQESAPGPDPAPSAAPVVPLRGRRTRQVLLGAAAAVAVVAVGVPVTLSVTGSEDGAESTVSAGAGDSPDPEGAESGRAQSEGAPSEGALSEDLAGSDLAEPPEGLAASPKSAPDQRGEDAGAPAGAELLLSPTDFDEQVAAFVERGGIGPVPSAACGAPAEGRRVAARYEGDLGTLLLTPVEDGIRARLYVCGRAGVVQRVDVRVD